MKLASLTQELVEHLGESIVVGAFVDRSFPTEVELATRFRAGRATVRGAVKMLVAKGLLHARAGQGTFVAPECEWSLFDPDVLRWFLAKRFSLSTLAYLTEVRLGAEPAAAALAARRMSDGARRDLQHALKRMKAAVGGEGDVLAAKIAFHFVILDATGNPLYRGLKGLVSTALRLSVIFANRGRRPVGARGYDALSSALLAGDAERAEAAMRVIVVEVMRSIAPEPVQ